MLIGAALGLGLAAAVGFRVFVPFLLVSIAARGGQVHLAGGFEWLGSDIALVMFGIAAVLEIAAYLIPFFDHLLDTVAGPAAVAAGTVLMASTLIDMEPWLRWAVAIVAGGGTAGLLHGATSALRLGSTATTGGTGNPVFAMFETGASTAMTVLALLLPMIAFALVLFLIVRTVRMVGGFFRGITRRPGREN
ncbi:MAG: DUF4126 domain-containing protein [Candidatus Krumholzibacteria bacterium]|nr:DUF4126 domain-containing protein [Candidatus Krumholzibacteria bacterium]